MFVPSSHTAKKTFFSATLAIWCLTANSQENVAERINTLVPIEDINALNNRPVQEVRVSKAFFDGLGRPIQQVVKQGSKNSTTGVFADFVSFQEYENFDRTPKSYLPFVSMGLNGQSPSQSGNFKSNAIAEQTAFYNQVLPGEQFFHQTTVFDNSPLNRVLESYAPGISWSGSQSNSDPGLRRNTAVLEYTNKANDAVRIWTVSNNTQWGEFGSYQSTTTYAPGQLLKTITIDEHKKQVIEFKDKNGQVILKKVQLEAASDDGTGRNYSGWICTYYIYDDLGNLRCVIQPEGVNILATNGWQLNATLLQEQCFRYEYDSKLRMIRKKVPGSADVLMVYDMRSRLILSQDGLLRASSPNRWMLSRYDDLDRVTMTGLWSSSLSFQQICNSANNALLYPGLLNASNFEELTRNYYDNYAWLPPLSLALSSNYLTNNDSQLSTSTNQFPFPIINQKSDETRGLVTGTKVKKLGSNPAQFYYTVNIYDSKNRLIQVQSTNTFGGRDVTTTQYNWAGLPLLTISEHDKPSTPAQKLISIDRIQYDELGRIITVENKVSSTLINNGAFTAYKTTVENKYDALGQLQEKRLAPYANNGLGLETQRFDYNIRGWLLGMNREFAKEPSKPIILDLTWATTKWRTALSEIHHTQKHNTMEISQVWYGKTKAMAKSDAMILIMMQQTGYSKQLITS